MNEKAGTKFLVRHMKPSTQKRPDGTLERRKEITANQRQLRIKFALTASCS